MATTRKKKAQRKSASKSSSNGAKRKAAAPNRSISNDRMEEIAAAAKKKPPKLTGPKKGGAITPTRWGIAKIQIRGTSPLVICRKDDTVVQQIMQKQMEGSVAEKSKREKKAKDFEELYERAFYTSTDGWHGINALSFRNALVRVCKLVGWEMTLAKACIFVVADGHDAKDGTPLVEITKGKPHFHAAAAKGRSQSGVDVRARPMWDPGWEATVTIRFDAGWFTPEDVISLMMRVGVQNGIGEGRAFSSNSNGLGWGEFEVYGYSVHIIPVPKVNVSVKEA